jgi:aconitate hydratase 2 / 2-methylisocitrate dehydratase
MLETYRQHTAERAALGIPPLPLDAEQTSALCELLKNPPAGEAANLLALLRDWALPTLRERVPPGVDAAAYVKAGFLTSISTGKITSPLINPIESILETRGYANELLGTTMLGGYNVRSVLFIKSGGDDIRQEARIV